MFLYQKLMGKLGHVSYDFKNLIYINMHDGISSFFVASNDVIYDLTITNSSSISLKWNIFKITENNSKVT